MRSSHKLKFKRRKCIHSIEQPLISLDLKCFTIQMKLRYLKSILLSRSSLLPSYCSRTHFLVFLSPTNLNTEQPWWFIESRILSTAGLFILILLLFQAEWFLMGGQSKDHQPKDTHHHFDAVCQDDHRWWTVLIEDVLDVVSFYSFCNWIFGNIILLRQDDCQHHRWFQIDCKSDPSPGCSFF